MFEMEGNLRYIMPDLQNSVRHCHAIICSEISFRFHPWTYLFLHIYGFGLVLAKYGNVNENSLSSSSSESEDDDGKDITEGTDRTIYRILSALQSKDSRCYDPNYKFFSDKSDEESEREEEEDKAKQSTKKKKDNPMFLKDYEREVIVKRKGKLDDMSETSEEEEDETKETACYYEQQKEFQMSFMKAGAGNEEEDDDDDESEDLVNIKVSSLDEKKKREEDGYVEWLKGQKNEIDESLAKDLEPLRNFYNDPNLDENEKFLRDYFLNKRYKDDDESELDEEEVLKEVEADEKEFDAEELFVAKVNHRFEEPDKEFIKSYPRTIGGSLRNKDVKRAEKRKQVKERKLAEKQKEKEELKRLKNLKKKEVQEKLEKLKMIMGNDSVDLTEQDLEEDFDPDKHDAVMEKLIGEDYYDQDDDDEKPVFDLDDFDDIDETWEDDDDSEEVNDNEDDSKPFGKQPQPGHSRDHASTAGEGDRIEKPKKQKKTKFTEELEKLKQTLDSNEMSQEQYINEILSRMDYEDKVGDVTFRFGYRNVTPCDYGLTVAEVLKAPERELNSWVSVKKMSQYRTEEEEKWDVKLYKKKSNDVRKKFNILPSLGSDKSAALNEKAAASSSAGAAPNDTSLTSSKKQRKRKRKQTSEGDTCLQNIQHNVTSSDTDIKEIKPQKAKKLKTDDGTASTNHKKNSEMEIARTKNSGTESREENGEKKKGKKRKKKHGGPSVPTMSSDRLEAYGINEKKFKYVIQNKLHQEMKKKQKKQKS